MFHHYNFCIDTLHVGKGPQIQEEEMGALHSAVYGHVPLHHLFNY